MLFRSNRGRDVAVSNDGKWLAVASNKVTLYGASTLDYLWSHDNECNSVSFSPDSRQLVSGNVGEVKVLDVRTGRRVKSFRHENVQKAVFSHDGTRVLSGEYAPSLREPSLIHLSASFSGTCRLWDLSVEEQEDPVRSVKFSENGSLLAIRQSVNLEMWETSTWKCLWSVQCEADYINFSPGGLQVLAGTKVYDVRAGGTLGDDRHVLESMYDHVHLVSDELGKWECSWCMRSFEKKGEYWFNHSDRWLSIVEEHGLQHVFQFIEDYGNIRDIKGCQSYVAFVCHDELLVLDTSPQV